MSKKQRTWVFIIQQNIRECFDTIVNIRGGHAPGHHDLNIRFSKWQLVLAHPSNFFRYSRDILYISLSKVQWCVHGHWIHMERSYGVVNVLITSVFWFNPACSIYVKILWWYSCPQLCLLSDNSRYQIWIYNNYIFLPGHISSIDSKWYTGLPYTHWKHTSLILVLDYDIFTI